jgi:RNA polymerase sigma-70 factor, ECF subfamily
MAQITASEAAAGASQQPDRQRPARNRTDPPKLASDDRNLQEQIVDLIPRLRRYARALTHDASAADDLVQECLTRALDKTHLWQPGTDLRAWLFTILYRQCISHARRDRRQRDHLASLKAISGSICSPDQMAQLELRELARALANLPAGQRAAILLVGLEGMGYEEAAAVLNTPVGTIRSRVFRGRETLRAATGLSCGRHDRHVGKPGNANSLARPMLSPAPL